MIAPVSIKTTGWPRIRDTCHRLGWEFDAWQDGAGRLILARRADGSYAADTVVISIPRQVGKTYLIACIIFALCLLEPGLTVIWTAHRKPTAAETFGQFDGMAQRPRVAPHVAQVFRGKGDERILFANGSRILFGARETGFGRGFSDVDVLVFDEAQIMTESAMEDMAAAQNVAKDPITFFMGTPPRPRDPGEVFTLLRQEALEGDTDTSLYIEMSADRDADPVDREQWRKANPSFPTRTTERAMLRLRKKLKSDGSWRREALGIWDELAKQQSVVSPLAWSKIEDVGPAHHLRPTGMAVDMSHARSISVGACWVERESAHGEEVWAGVSVEAAVEWVALRAGRRMPVAIDSMSPAASMIPLLKARGVHVVTTGAGDMGKACGLVFDEMQSGRLTHAGQDSLTRAVLGARKRAIGKIGSWGWDRTQPDVDISPLVAWTLARFAASLERVRTGERRTVGTRTVGNRRAVVS